MRKIFISLIFIFGLILFGLSVRSVYAGACDCSGGGVTGDLGCYAYQFDPELNKMVCSEFASDGCQDACCTMQGLGCDVLGCFLPSTLVNSSTGTKKIEDIKVGDRVSSFENNQTFQSKVDKIYEVKRDHYFSLVAGDYSVKATAEHPFLTINNKYKEIKDLKAGDIVYVLENESLIQKIVTSNTRINEPTVAYNLSVDNKHTFFADDFAVHNKGFPACGSGLDISCGSFALAYGASVMRIAGYNVFVLTLNNGSPVLGGIEP